MSASGKISRRKLAQFVASRLDSPSGDLALKQAAAYMIATKRKHSTDLLVRDVEEILANDGKVVADLTSAHKLSDEDKTAITRLLGAKKLYARETIDPAVLGGIRIEAAGKRLDATLKHKIDRLIDIDSQKGTK